MSLSYTLLLCLCLFRPMLVSSSFLHHLGRTPSLRPHTVWSRKALLLEIAMHTKITCGCAKIFLARACQLYMYMGCAFYMLSSTSDAHLLIARHRQSQRTRCAPAGRSPRPGRCPCPSHSTRALRPGGRIPPRRCRRRAGTPAGRSSASRRGPSARSRPRGAPGRRRSYARRPHHRCRRRTYPRCPPSAFGSRIGRTRASACPPGRRRS
mmetsp:Transcript_12529/g.37683  ORF Transcript_12529/g.37683 Transcript_12529/m.37683 type:complete len:209 (+) Transcript_12529:1243-1869(+)